MIPNENDKSDDPDEFLDGLDEYDTSGPMPSLGADDIDDIDWEDEIDGGLPDW